MLNFYPGPSKVYSEVRAYMQDAYDEGILSTPHRGEQFVQLSRAVVGSIKRKLNIPQDYYIFFTSSATECWEILIQSLTTHKSFHIYNGSFGEKWCQYAKNLRPKSEGYKFDVNEPMPVDQLEISTDTELICFTQNETSNGTQVSATTILNLHNKFRDTLIAVDATSSMAGLNLKLIKADIWFASVQKCFGLPAGLGIMACSPRAIFRAKQMNERGHYNSLVSMYEKMLNYQTTHTPNVLNIYLLKRMLEDREFIKSIDQQLSDRAEDLYTFFSQFTDFKLLIENEEVRSKTVIAIEAPERLVDEAKKRALYHNIRLGNGYGPWARNSFRIANFPAILDEEYEELKRFFLHYYA
ncbi:aminotransferase class V-fold PLP-dependent enzyme [Pontibacter cellulosilyticus]|uniref:Alanine--glyoxylate aminotransferase family protein n=1 Tax=Pontibacter cellulosilyticus TaxID=1720253 RepID=A0A923N6U4_9BACT|nr:aminotransferase class V-fold PLP-dependent enzyme [Pontibacter cellulosilyticus]MBC5993306.1 alanine--glyoxylate aminotransferase family protein [Pontibacter cellulosilyticus]